MRGVLRHGKKCAFELPQLNRQRLFQTLRNGEGNRGRRRLSGSRMRAPPALAKNCLDTSGEGQAGRKPRHDCEALANAKPIRMPTMRSAIHPPGQVTEFALCLAFRGAGSDCENDGPHCQRPNGRALQLSRSTTSRRLFHNVPGIQCANCRLKEIFCPPAHPKSISQTGSCVWYAG